MPTDSSLGKGNPTMILSKRSKRIAGSCVAALALALAAASPAAAAEPLKIRELYPGSAVHGTNAEFVELQMSADGQAQIEGQELRFFEADGDLAATFVLGDDSALVGEIQRTVLLATPAAAALGGAAAAPDYALPAADRIDPVGGAACFTAAGGGSPADCVAWGSFPVPGPFEPSLLPDSQSSNASAIAAGLSLHRDIARGCSTFLDAADDSGSSAADFEQAAPSPHGNATARPHGELRCPPTATISSGPTVPFANPSNSTSASFAYATAEGEPGASFQCHLDSALGQTPPATPPSEGEWAACDAQPQTYAGLADGFYRFWVRALGENPAPGPPASRAWQLDATAPQTAIDSVPPEPSSGFEARFTFSSSEPQSSFRCQLDGGPVQVCANNAASGSRSYFALADGVHTFSVYATDNADNVDPTPATATFTVQTVLGDRTPPDTVVRSAPASPSSSATATFTYSSNEPGSSFECRLDAQPFSPCPASGIGYGPLKNGAHAFEVRATDPAGNVDSVPAAYGWTVRAPLPRTRFAKAPPGTVRVAGRRAKLTFKLRSDKPGSSFRCRLDRRAFKPCKAKVRLTVRLGRHRFEAYAIDRLGNVEETPARRIVRVQRKRSGGLFG